MDHHEEMKEEQFIVKDDTRTKNLRNPLETTNILFKFTYDWITPLIFRGAIRTLQAEDVYELPKNDKAHVLCEKLSKEFEKRKDKKRGLLMALHSCFGLKFWLAGFFKLLTDMLVVASPLFVKYLLEDLDDPRDWIGWVWVSALFVAQLGITFFGNWYNYFVNTVSVQLMTSTSSIVYKKSLFLSYKAKLQKTNGEIINLLAVDSQKLGEVIMWAHLGWTSCFTIAVSMGLLFWILGWVALVGLAAMVLTLPIQAFFMYLWFKYAVKMSKYRDERLKLISEIISGIRIIKFFNWEDNFVKKVEKVRRIEVIELLKFSVIRAISLALFMASPVFVSVITFVVYYLVGNELTVSVVFSSLAYFNIMRMPLSIIVVTLNYLMEGLVATNRIQQFLLLEEIPPIQSHTEKEFPIIVENATFQWAEREEKKSRSKSLLTRLNKKFARKTDSKTVITKTVDLENISFKVKRGELLCIVGKVGSGKSSLLNGILGEMPKIKGKVSINGSIAYCPQEAWIQNCTLRDNITFGKEYNHEKYNTIINICALRKDLDILEYGDLTEIGEKGINLSGGQRQRVSIARAVYQDRDIYIFDDPLSAVDPEVGKHIFEHCILNYLKGKTRILVTHQLHFLSYADSIIVIDDGIILESGTFEELNRKRDGHLRRLLLLHLAEEEKKKKPEKEIETPRLEVVAKQMTKEEERKRKEKAKLIQEEQRESGGISYSAIWTYIMAGGGPIVVLVILLLFAIAQISIVASDVWMSLWVSNAFPSLNNSRWNYLIIYSCLGVASALFAFLRNLLYFFGGVVASSRLHSKTLRRVIRAPMSFFDSTPLGRFLNIFSKDQELVDTTFVSDSNQTINSLFQIIASIAIMATAQYWLLVPLVPIFVFYYIIQSFYRSTSRELQRIEAITRSPLYSHFSESLAGRSTIRAFKKEEDFIKTNQSLVNSNMKTIFAQKYAARWLSGRLEVIGSTLVLAIAVFIVIFRNDKGMAGLGLVYSLQMTQFLGLMIQYVVYTEAQMSSVERITHYINTPTEPVPSKNTKIPPNTWPEKGEIIFDNYQMRYRPGMELVLRGVNAHIKPCERIGVVGRSGAGKSSLLLCLYRMIEAAGGSITIDGYNIAEIPLSKLRKAISIIPQEPILFTGTVRSNLDPFNEYDDAFLWKVLEKSYMKSKIEKMEKKLDSPVSAGGENFSVGERQLLCLARAMCRKTKILLIDECTASVDVATDAKIQKTIEEEFNDCTRLTIAHRLNTIIDSDRVLVMDKGIVVEFDTPEALISKKGGVFSQMVAKTGKANAKKIREKIFLKMAKKRSKLTNFEI